MSADRNSLYALAVNAAAERSPFGHPLAEAELRSVYAAVDAVADRLAALANLRLSRTHGHTAAPAPAPKGGRPMSVDDTMTTYLVTTSPYSFQRVDEHGVLNAMQEHGFRYSELRDHLDDLNRGHVLTADDGTTFRATLDPQESQEQPMRDYEAEFKWAEAAARQERIAEALERRVINNPTGDVAVALNEAYLRAARIAREETIR